ncbi:hypothetical protein E2562_003719 [Oryza meyeriana var. granulata]|uniref:Uncharacterized protein n=1 Tax=Oryza meyeriana var. granulata TaxID=110450 RepID=A0A6G1C2F3_9ORYZ|nr:hypothetical protein E2562_003719 [Oryza meyeriana var. granulata]
MKLFEIVERCARVDEAIKHNDGKGKAGKQAKPSKRNGASTTKQPEQPKNQKKSKRLKVHRQVLAADCGPPIAK